MRQWTPAVAFLLLGLVVGVVLTLGVLFATGIPVGGSECARALARYERSSEAINRQNGAASTAEHTNATAGVRFLCGSPS